MFVDYGPTLGNEIMDSILDCEDCADDEVKDKIKLPMAAFVLNRFVIISLSLRGRFDFTYQS